MTIKDLRSDGKFAELLRAEGVEEDDDLVATAFEEQLRERVLVRWTDAGDGARGSGGLSTVERSFSEALGPKLHKP